MEDDSKASDNGDWQLGLVGQFWFGGGGWSACFTSSARLARDFSRRGRSRADHHIGQCEERVELMAVLGQSSIPRFPMAK